MRMVGIRHTSGTYTTVPTSVEKKILYESDNLHAHSELGTNRIVPTLFR
jgi:hypothetical protein